MTIGKVYGLFVGTNYPGTDYALSGCVNDATDWEANLGPLCEKQQSLIDNLATKEAIVDGLKSLISAMKYKDDLVFTYSGHGSWVPDVSGDEPDGRDEVICPVDFRSAGVLTDDELDAIFAKRKYGTRIIFISDSCFSGSVYRMAGSQPTDQQKKIRFMPPDQFLEGKKRDQAVQIVERVATSQARILTKDKPRAGIVTLSGCLDNEYSYDAWFTEGVNSRANGAFTYNALQCWKELAKGGTYADWMKLISAKLPSYEYPQTPRLGATTTYARKVAIGKE